LPTPCARDGKGPGLPYGLPDLVEEGGTRFGLLPTPRASDTGTPGRRAGAGFRPPLSQVLLPNPTVADSRSSANATAGRSVPLTGHQGHTVTDAARLLPTPRASDGEKGCPGQRGSHGDLTLPAAAVLVPVLPTPRASDGHGLTFHGDGGLDLTTTVGATLPDVNSPDDSRWGKYAAAVARWEHLLGRPVPEPTQPGRHDRPVLAPPFVEWLMGLPQGWVTDPNLGLPRTRALQVLGNGVVPQQAAAALRLLLCPCRWNVPGERVGERATRGAHRHASVAS
jgi:hypothetical protein